MSHHRLFSLERRPPVPAWIGRVRFAAGKSAWLWLNLGAGALGATQVAWSPGLVVACALLTYATLCLGHSVCLHRALIHRALVLHPLARRALLGLFALTGLGGPLSWIRLHAVRDHWQSRSPCPPYFAYRHALLRDFWWNLHCSFEPVEWSRYALDQALLRDPLLRWLQRFWWTIPLGFTALLVPLVGWPAALVLGPGRVAGGILGHWFIGYRTHRHGPQPFEIPGATEHGSNSTVLGWISFGEGFHNNHHAFPGSARIGMERWQFDLGWWSIRWMERLGIATEVRSWCRGSATSRARRADTPSAASRPAFPAGRRVRALPRATPH